MIVQVLDKPSVVTRDLLLMVNFKFWLQNMNNALRGVHNQELIDFLEVLAIHF